MKSKRRDAFGYRAVFPSALVRSMQARNERACTLRVAVTIAAHCGGISMPFAKARRRMRRSLRPARLLTMRLQPDVFRPPIHSRYEPSCRTVFRSPSPPSSPFPRSLPRLARSRGRRSSAISELVGRLRQRQPLHCRKPCRRYRRRPRPPHPARDARCRPRCSSLARPLRVGAAGPAHCTRGWPPVRCNGGSMACVRRQAGR